MFRTPTLTLAVTVLIAGCQNHSETPPAEVQNTPAPGERAAETHRPAAAQPAKDHAAAKPGTPALPFKTPYEMARKTGWNVAKAMIDAVLETNAEEWPAAKAWLADYHKLTRGIDPAIPIETWPTVDIDALLDHNPDFWRMYYEIAPGDSGLAIIHVGLLLSQGEAMRAQNVLKKKGVGSL